MTVRRLTFVAVVLVVAVPKVGAQQALVDLEQRLQNELPNPATLADPAAAQEPGYLGILANESAPLGRGVTLVDVLPGGPAAVAGLQVGDLVTSIDGRGVHSLDDMAALLASRAVGERLAFVAIRGVDALRIDVTLTKRPPPDARRFPTFGRLGDAAGAETPVEIASPVPQPTPTIVAPAPMPELPAPLPAPTSPSPSGAQEPAATDLPRTGLLGIRAVEVTPELALAMNLPEPKGAMIVEVRPQSPAALAGVPVGAVITSAMGRPVTTPAELAAAVRGLGDGAELKLSYTRFGQSTEKSIRLAAPAATPATSPIANEPLLPAAPKSVAEENAQLRKQVEQLEARLKELEAARASQPAAPQQP